MGYRDLWMLQAVLNDTTHSQEVRVA